MFPSPALQHAEEKQGVSCAVASLHLTEEPLAFFKSLWFGNRSKESNAVLHVIQCYSVEKKISISLINNKPTEFSNQLSVKSAKYMVSFYWPRSEK